MEPITADVPKVIVSKEWKHWWMHDIKGFTVNENTPLQTFGISFVFVRGNKGEYGNWETSLLAEDAKTITIDDIFLFAQEEATKGNMQPAQTIENIVILAATLAKQQGIID